MTGDLYYHCRTNITQTLRDMNNFEKDTNIAGIVLFGVLGTAGLIGAILCRAWHQLITVGIGALMVWALWAEIRRENKKDKQLKWKR